MWITTLLLVACIVVARAWNAFAFPCLDADDGWRFVWCFQHGGSDLWTWRHSGYVTVLPNALTALASFAPLGVQPILYAAAAGTVASLALSMFASRRFRGVLRDDWSRAALCVMVALAPHGNARLVASALWTYIAFAWMGALLAMTPPTRGPRRWLEFVVASLLTASSPFSLAIVPVRLVQAIRSRRDRTFHLALVAVAVVYAAVMMSPDPERQRDPLVLAAAGLRLLSQRVIAESLLGGASWPALGWLVWPFSALVVGWLAVAILRLPPRPRRFAVALTAVILVASAMAVAGRAHMGMPDVWWGNRYTYMQRIGFHLLVGLVVAHRLAAASAPLRRKVVLLGLVHAMGLAWIGNEQYELSPRAGEQVLAWAAAAETWQHEPPGERRPLGLRRPGEWSLELR